MLNSAAPDKTRLAVMELSEVFKLAKKHMLASAIYMSLEQADCLGYLDKELSSEWCMYTDAVIRKNILMDVERKNILERFEKEGIWYMPLKGCIIAGYYPDYGMREMADNDILFDAAFQEKVRDIMIQRGYHVESYNESNHDVYLKEPVYNFEMHRDLMAKQDFPELYEYFADIRSRLINNADKQYECHFSNEDFYIYFIGHAYKHYEYCGGTGLRTLADVYLLNRSFEMERGYLNQEFKKLHINEYEQGFSHLAEKVFGEHDLIYHASNDMGFTYQEKHMLEYILGSGVFGTRNNIIRKQLVEEGGSYDIHFSSRLTYILHRIYPKGRRYLERYPFFYKHVLAYVFLPVYRLVRRGNITSLIREAKLALKIR